MQVSTVAPIDRKTGKVTLYIARVATGELRELHLQTHSFDALHGYRVEMVGRRVTIPTPAPGYYFCEFALPNIPTFTLQVALIAATWPDSPIRAYARWRDEGGVIEDTELLAPDPSEDDRIRAVKGV